MNRGLGERFFYTLRFLVRLLAYNQQRLSGAYRQWTSAILVILRIELVALLRAVFCYLGGASAAHLSESGYQVIPASIERRKLARQRAEVVDGNTLFALAPGYIAKPQARCRLFRPFN